MRSDLAKQLLSNSTAPERRLWRILFPLRTSGYHFRKQVQVGPYVVDFACLRNALVIEVDGETHNGATAAANDELRNDYLIGRGFRVLRFSNDEVLKYPDGVYAVVVSALGKQTEIDRVAPPSPTLPARGRVPTEVRARPVPSSQESS